MTLREQYDAERPTEQGRYDLTNQGYVEWLEARAKGWIRISDNPPEPNKTVWLASETWAVIGCKHVVPEGGWQWAVSNGLMYSEGSKIVAECEADDVEPIYWHEIPELPRIKAARQQGALPGKSGKAYQYEKLAADSVTGPNK